MSVGNQYTGHAGSQGQPMLHFDSFGGKEDQTFMSINGEQTQDDTAVVDLKKKKGSASSIANDLELRRLFKENKHRDLKDVATSVLAEERGPRSEKTKQIFAMNWLSVVCKKGTGSVPRNRVFSHYATRCGNERVPPLNPASFGKLVRIIFPGIQTRRLGMRGESKYHYVDLELVDETSDSNGGAGFQPRVVGGASDGPPFQRYRSQLPADTAVFPSPNLHIESNSVRPKTHSAEASGCLYLNPALPSIHRAPAMPNMVRRELKFPTITDNTYPDDEPIELPSLQGHVPAGTDPDAANALKALYRTHCISVIDCFRFCKEKMFWHHFTSFHGTLTVPVQKLLAHPNMAAWIQECDWLMYQKMIRFVAPLALQVVPMRALDTFRAMSTKLGPHILSTFQNHPQHVRDAKHGPAVIFAGLLDRLLRVIATAHAAARLLTNSGTRDQMWLDWVTYVKPLRVAETSLPGAGYTRTLQILTNDVRELLGPLSNSYPQEMQPIFADAATSSNAEYSHQSQAELDDSSTEGVLDRWVTFLNVLPSRFPGVDARLLLHCVGQVGSAALRDITMAEAPSFGCWWVTKTWVDEMLQWLAEKGGFLEHSPSSMEMRPQKRTAYDAGFDVDDENGDYPHSRPCTGFNEGTGYQGPYGSMDMSNGFHHQQDQINSHSQDHERRSMQNDGNFQMSTAPNRGFDRDPDAEQGGYQRPPNGSYVKTANAQSGNYNQTSTDENEGYNQRPTSQSGGHRHINTVNTGSAVPSHLAKQAELDNMQSNDDSAIGLDLDLPQQAPSHLADYGGFVANGGNTASDPADVVVC